ncbi:hypothetical protein [Streptomyces stelliscabiei]|uniref:hypothetical protein n=1 Tax=Streptomyces stelliscabiei TaxID=146820 RepID=UPI003A92410D
MVAPIVVSARGQEGGRGQGALDERALNVVEALVERKAGVGDPESQLLPGRHDRRPLLTEPRCCPPQFFAERARPVAK